MTREAKIIVAVLAGSALLVGGAIVAAAIWFLSVRPHDPGGPLAVEGPVEAGESDYGDYDDEDYEDPGEEELREAEKRLGPEHTDLVPLLIDVADGRMMDGNADDAIPLLERAVRIQERGPDGALSLLDTLDMLGDAHEMRQDHEGSVAVLKKILEHTTSDDDPVLIAGVLVRLATAQVRAGHDERAQPLVSRARRLIAKCDARGACLGDELVTDLTQLDFARAELAIAAGDTAGANRLMRGIRARAARDGGEPCDVLAEALFGRIENLVLQCEQLTLAGSSDEADRAYVTVFRMFTLAESAGGCTEHVDPYLVSDLTLSMLHADLKAGEHAKARGRIDQLSRYARAHFDRGELREMVRYDITEVVLEVAEDATGDGRLEEIHRLQRFVLQLYASMGLGDSPSMCEVVTDLSESDQLALEEHLMANEIDAAEKLVESLRRRFDDHRIRTCAAQILHELALTFVEQALDASNRLDPASTRRLLAIATDLCRTSGPECLREVREAERELTVGRSPDTYAFFQRVLGDSLTGFNGSRVRPSTSYPDLSVDQ